MSRQAFWAPLAIVMLIVFTLPTWTLIAASLPPGLNGERPLGQAFFLMLFNPTPFWDLTRGAVAVLLTAIAGLGLADRLSLRASVVVIGLLVALAGLGLAFFILMNPVVGANVWEMADQTYLSTQIDNSDAFYTKWNGYLVGQAGVLGGNLALFLGLTAKNRAKDTGTADEPDPAQAGEAGQ